MVRNHSPDRTETKSSEALEAHEPQKTHGLPAPRMIFQKSIRALNVNCRLPVVGRLTNPKVDKSTFTPGLPQAGWFSTLIASTRTVTAFCSPIRIRLIAFKSKP